MARTLCEITSAHRYAPREVVSDPKAPYFGVEINDRSLTPGEGARTCRDSFRRLAEHLGPKVKPKKTHTSNSTYGDSLCFRLLTNALTGAILFTTAALQAEEADQGKGHGSHDQRLGEFSW